MADHSIYFGGSIAARRLNCDASFQESLKQPQGRVTSSYAEEGTALHEAMAWLLVQPSRIETELHEVTPQKIAQRAVGQTFNDRVITDEDAREMIAPALAALADLMTKYGGGFRVAALEAKVAFPNIPDAFGGVDLILQSDTHVLVVDYKFGAGVKVEVIYRDDIDGDVLNEQLMFYAVAAKRTHSRLFGGGRQVVIAIIQPPFGEQASDVEIDARDMRDFKRAMERAAVRALRANPKHNRGEWCRFAECKATCPLWTGPLLDLSAINSEHLQVALKASAKPAPDREWGVYLSAAKRLVDSAIMYKKLIDEALVEHLKNGGQAPGWALKPKTVDRKWLDDTRRVARELGALGFAQPDIWREPQLQTFKTIDAAAKRLKVKIPDELRPRPVTHDVTLTAEGDPDAIATPQLTEDFRTALKALRG